MICAIEEDTCVHFQGGMTKTRIFVKLLLLTTETFHSSFNPTLPILYTENITGN